MITTIDVPVVPAPPSAPRPVAKGRAQAPGHQPGHAHGRAAEVAHPFAEALAVERQPVAGDDTTDGSPPEQQPVAAPSPTVPTPSTPVTVPEVALVMTPILPLATDPVTPAGPVTNPGPDAWGTDPLTATVPLGDLPGAGSATVSGPAAGPVPGLPAAGLQKPDVPAADPSTHPGTAGTASQETGPGPTAAVETAQAPIAVPVPPDPAPDQAADAATVPAAETGVDATPEGWVTGEPVADHDLRPAGPDHPARPKVAGRPAEDADPAPPAASAGRPVEPASPAPAAPAGPAAPSPAAAAPAASPPAAPVTGTPGAEISTVTRSEPGAVADQAPSSAQPWQQVVEVLRPLKRFSDGSHRLSIRLRPEELGTVHVELSLHRGSLSLHLVAEHAAARDLLARSLGSLRAELEAAGVRTGWLDVGSRTAQDQGTPGGSPRGTTPWAPAGRSDRAGGVPASVALPTVPSVRPVAADGRLDLRL